jgi:hypothetical protein
MTSTYAASKSKRKIHKLTDVTDALYVFGGKNSNG